MSKPIDEKLANLATAKGYFHGALVLILLPPAIIGLFIWWLT